MQIARVVHWALHSGYGEGRVIVTKASVYKAIAFTIIGNIMFNTQAGSVGFDSMSYDGSTGQVTVTVVYDFTDVNVFGGALNLLYDASALTFVSYEQAPLQDDVWAPASPIGSLDAPGVYGSFGIGANKVVQLFGGITSAGPIGTFIFDVMGTTNPGSTPCGMTLCLQTDSLNFWYYLDGLELVNLSEELMSNGISEANVVVPVPVPPAIMLFMGGLCGLLGFSRSHSR